MAVSHLFFVLNCAFFGPKAQKLLCAFFCGKTNVNHKVHNILGDTDYDFEICFFTCWIPNFQISKPGLGQAWAGLDTARVDLVEPGLDWTGPGPGLACLFDVLSMFPPLMKKPPIFSVPWFLEASFVFLGHQVSKPLSCIFQSRC